MSKPQDCTVADVLDLRLREPEEGDVIGSVSGRIQKVWDWKDGDGKYGRYSFQNIELVDGRDTIKVVLKDRDELNERDWKGAQVIISSTEGKKGYTGVKAKDDVYKGKTTRIVWVTATADITEDRGGAPSRDKERSDDRREAPREREPERENRREERPVRGEDRGSAEKKVWRPLGVTVGMVINCACASLTAQGKELDPIEVYKIASDLVWVSKKMEMGQLAPFSKPQAKQERKEEKKEERREEPPREEPPKDETPEEDKPPF